MASFKIVAVAVGLVFALGFINASSIPDQLGWKYDPDSETDEEMTEDFEAVLQIAESAMDSKKTPPASCKCEGTTCNCCKTIKIFKWRKDACVEVQYKKEDSSFGIKVTFGSRVLFTGTKSATGSEPTCFKSRYVPGVKLCVDVTDFKSEGDKTHGCASVSAKLLVKTVAFKMGCFDLGAEQTKRSASTDYFSGPGEEPYGIESPIGWTKTKRNIPLPREDDQFLFVRAYDEQSFRDPDQD